MNSDEKPSPQASSTQSATSVAQSHVFLETCQFVIDRQGCVVASDKYAANWLGYHAEELRGQPLRQLLIALEPHWDSLLPDNLSGEEALPFLPLPTPESEDAGPIGARLQRLQCGDNIFVTLTPALGGYREICEAGLQEFPQTPETFAQLLFRLKASEGRLQSYMQNFPGVFYSQRPDFSFNFIGPSFSETTGIPLTDGPLKGAAFIEAIVGKDRERFLKLIEEKALDGKTFSLTYRVRSEADDSIRYLLDVRSPKISGGGLLLEYEGVLMDITRQAIAENHLSSTAWKESLATLTGGLVHDFSNMMAGIFSLSELYFDGMSPDHAMYTGMRQIKNSSFEAQRLVRRIIDLNREVASQKNYHNLEGLIREQLDLLPVILPKSCKLVTNFSNNEIPVFLDDVAFRQLLLNFCMNARDAIDSRKGEVGISVRYLGAGEAAFEGAVCGGFTTEREGAEIRFSDNGCGIEPSLLKKIFEPFFTTKELSKGSGFGLYNACLFVKECGGKLSVFSEPNVGTTFYIFLPAADFTESFEEKINTPSTAGNRGGDLSEPEAATRRPRETMPVKDARRRSVIIYVRQDPENSALINLFREAEWETIAFSDVEQLKRYLGDSVRPPDVAIAVNMGADPEVEPLLDFLSETYPKVRRFMQITGVNPDALPERLEDKVIEIYDENQRDCDVVSRINLLIR